MNLSALSSSNYRLYFFGSVTSVNGLWILRIVLTWLAWKTSGTASFVGLIAALTLIPTMFVGPLFGVLVDRSNIVRSAYATTIGMILVTLAILLVEYFAQMSVLFIVFIALVIGIITSAHHPVRLSMGPRLVSIEHIKSVVALAALNFNLARAVSPFIAGILIDQLGVVPALMITLALYIPNLIILRKLKPRSNPTPKQNQSLLSAFKEGANYVWSRPYLRLIMLATALMAFSIRAVMEILPVIADGSFERGAIGLGQLGAAVGMGALLAAILKTFGSASRSFAFANMTTFVFGLGIIATMILGVTGSWLFALISAAFAGFSNTQLGVTFQSEVQTDLSDNLRGRVMSLWIMTGLGSVSIGSLLIGYFADVMGLPITSIIVGSFSLICLAIITLRSRIT